LKAVQALGKRTSAKASEILRENVGSQFLSLGQPSLAYGFSSEVLASSAQHLLSFVNELWTCLLGAQSPALASLRAVISKVLDFPESGTEVADYCATNGLREQMPKLEICLA
jgi:hypothetical protein